MKLSVVIPAFNEERLLPRCLSCVQASLAAFTRLGWDTEVIVCDNNSSDRTSDRAREGGAVVVREPVNQISRARNRGAESATGDWLVFIDADSFPSPALFADLAEAISDPRCVGGGSTVRLEGTNGRPPFVVESWNLLSRLTRWAPGSCVFCETRAFRVLGGFSQELFVSEEIDFSRRLKRLARREGRRLVILHRHPLHTSDRKLSLYSRGEILRFMLHCARHPFAVAKTRAACGIWYDGRR